MLELGCLLRAYICLDGVIERSRQACHLAASCLCGDDLRCEHKPRPTSGHLAGKDHIDATAQRELPPGGPSGGERVRPPRVTSRRDFRLVGDLLDARRRERPLEEVRV